MKSFIRSSAAVLVVSFIAFHTAQAKFVPEIDPGMGAGALALIGGAILVIRGRRKV
jgi:hypothetical protein